MLLMTLVIARASFYADSTVTVVVFPPSRMMISCRCGFPVTERVGEMRRVLLRVGFGINVIQ